MAVDVTCRRDHLIGIVSETLDPAARCCGTKTMMGQQHSTMQGLVACAKAHFRAPLKRAGCIMNGLKGEVGPREIARPSTEVPSVPILFDRPVEGRSIESVNVDLIAQARYCMLYRARDGICTDTLRFALPSMPYQASRSTGCPAQAQKRSAVLNPPFLQAPSAREPPLPLAKEAINASFEATVKCVMP